ncbi:hypothetical protein BGX29_006261 [Mortierella sp. GBA35]|nr:hypothetical protein BGX23_006841 [Mortierella sp. AD031]KAF9100793.1 hypothetical protein BGX29_006261 [Mortierella sp. GBA35]
MRFSILAIAATVIGAAVAQTSSSQAYPTVPVANTVWTAGSAVTVQWKQGTPAPTTGLKITLFKGDPAHQTLVQDLGTSTVGATSLKATLPKDLPSDWYSIRIGSDSYSHYFLIKGTGPVPSAPAPTGITPNTSAVAIPSASGNSTIKPTGATTTTTATPAVTTVAKNAAGYLTAAPIAMAAVVAAAAALVF